MDAKDLLDRLTNALDEQAWLHREHAGALLAVQEAVQKVRDSLGPALSPAQYIEMRKRRPGNVEMLNLAAEYYGLGFEDGYEGRLHAVAVDPFRVPENFVEDYQVGRRLGIAQRERDNNYGHNDR